MTLYKRLKPVLAGMAPGAFWVPTYFGLQEATSISPWTVMLISSSAGIVYIQAAALLFQERLRIPLCLASTILLLLASYIASAVIFLALDGNEAEYSLIAAIALALAAAAYGFSIIFAGAPSKK